MAWRQILWMSAILQANLSGNPERKQEARRMHFGKFALERGTRSLILHSQQYSVPPIVQCPHGDADAEDVSMDVSKPVVELRIRKASLHGTDDWIGWKQTH